MSLCGIREWVAVYNACRMHVNVAAQSAVIDRDPRGNIQTAPGGLSSRLPRPSQPVLGNVTIKGA